MPEPGNHEADARRRELMLAALKRLSVARDSQSRDLERATELALARAPATPADADACAALVGRMAAALRESGLAPVPEAASLVAAFAQALVVRAHEEVQFEARRAGHEASFDRLKPWLRTELPVLQAARLAQDAGQTAAHWQLAHARLRQRFRQRVEAAIALWSAPGEQRRRLRRALHVAATTGEPA
jgi:hypothetical protein